jgi:hypothetical protein
MSNLSIANFDHRYQRVFPAAAATSPKNAHPKQESKGRRPSGSSSAVLIGLT